ncbi:hypothetical protein [Pontibacter ramchanderi]|uniref:hypothetical protein n=1 Tax=Pontibacter ramchanderi TaxID=1179743 RepID=UPI000C6FF469|nr:hypothetical protein [Pontibacter ramchanderi]
MKTLTAIACLVLVCLAAQAQDLDRPQLRLKPSHKKLDLRYNGRYSSSGILSPLQKPGSRYSLLPKSAHKKPGKAENTQLRGQMPILKPDSAVHFPILALKPDTAIAFPMPVIKP